ncbi:hypothetical protein PsorP6_003525 [Peronosclerospora sorghi]|uniref:Uncharacterized protein n=1 Tax=Peronosclerospora sorghi TaxID=230839 RepID=A0ACC0VL78_9STRA|nr:hypothetical protein PsorP6_003525 [Peronosclerospora sorghi]
MFAVATYFCRLQQAARMITYSAGEKDATLCALAILKEHKDFLKGLTDAIYNFHSPLVEGSVGQHTRHSLDHLRKPLEHLITQQNVSGENIVHYDFRDRHTSVEKIRSVAVEQIKQLEKTLYSVTRGNLVLPVHVAFMLSSNGHESYFESTINRELAFAVHHFIHHNALSKVLLRHHFPELEVPENFGIAPSTADFNQKCTSTLPQS